VQVNAGVSGLLESSYAGREQVIFYVSGFISAKYKTGQMSCNHTHCAPHNCVEQEGNVVKLLSETEGPVGLGLSDEEGTDSFRDSGKLTEFLLQEG